MPAPDGLHANLTRAIIGASYEVQRELGHGFLEKVYLNALSNELAGLGSWRHWLGLR
jgi:hypothetical protein